MFRLMSIKTYLVGQGFKLLIKFLKINIEHKHFLSRVRVRLRVGVGFLIKSFELMSIITYLVRVRLGVGVGFLIKSVKPKG